MSDVINDSMKSKLVRTYTHTCRLLDHAYKFAPTPSHREDAHIIKNETNNILHTLASDVSITIEMYEHYMAHLDNIHRRMPSVSWQFPDDV